MDENHEVVSDGKTVWVNWSDGCCIGRYRVGNMDIHKTADEQFRTGTECLDCDHVAPTWSAFKDGMLKHYGIAIADKHKPLNDTSV